LNDVTVGVRVIWGCVDYAAGVVVVLLVMWLFCFFDILAVDCVGVIDCWYYDGVVVVCVISIVADVVDDVGVWYCVVVDGVGLVVLILMI